MLHVKMWLEFAEDLERMKDNQENKWKPKEIGGWKQNRLQWNGLNHWNQQSHWFKLKWIKYWCKLGNQGELRKTGKLR